MTIKNDDSKTQFPADFEAQAKLRFEALDAKEGVDFSAFLRSEKVEFQRLAAIQANPALAYKPKLGTMTACGNGDFEKELDPNEWQGAIGPFPDLSAASPLAGFTAGIFSSSMSTDPNGHQSWVGAGPDPIAPISTTATNSAGAVRLGYQHNWPNGAMQKNVTLRVYPAHRVVHTDAILIHRIARNLLSNAIRYTNPGGRVVLGLRRAKGQFWLTVYDNGLGMSPEQTQACFEAFSRFGDTTRVPEGMGIGLFSVKRLAQQMDLPLRIMSRLHHGTAIGVGLIPIPDKYSMGSD